MDSVVLQPGPAVRSRWIQQDWPELAACRGLLDLFFPPAGEREPSRLVREAKARAICAECPVVAECRDYARHNRELGFWGGENDEERTIRSLIGSANQVEAVKAYFEKRDPDFADRD